MDKHNAESARRLLRAMFDAAVAAAQPDNFIARHLPAPPRGRTIVVGAGKASAAMARALERHWPGPLAGLVVTRYGYGVPCARIEIVEAAHPVPDEAGHAAARRMLDLVGGLAEDDLVICLISGGGSALLPLPAAGVTLAEKQALNAALLASGATIAEMNCVRRHVSGIKGGRLAAACHPARVVSLLVSDVPGDDPVDVASGPTVPDPTTCADALAILERYGVDAAPAILRLLRSGAGESVKPGAARLARAEAQLVMTPRLALDAAAAVAREAGVAVHVLGDDVEGEARDVGKVMAAIARSVARHGTPFAAPCILLSGGETTVTVRGDGRGGRNVEFLLSLAIELDGLAGVQAIACDTDGVDGKDDIAGALMGSDTIERARRAGLRPAASLANNDAHTFFGALGDAVVTGPTLTNVNDFRAIFVGRAERGSAPEAS
jgi:glycerate 2-kinase